MGDKFKDKYTPWRNKELLQELYVEKRLSAREIGEILDCGHTTLFYWMDKYGIETRDQSNLPPRITTSGNGYEIARSMTNGKVESVSIHRLLAVSEYGFDDIKGKDVHHKNGIKWDNRLENITVLDESKHKRLHIENQNEKKPYTDKETLKKLYQNMSRKELADEFGCTEGVIKYWLSKHGIRKSDLRRNE